MSSIKRKPHCLIREKTLAIPRHFIFFDTETEPEVLPDGSIKQNLKLGWACYYQRAYGRNRERVDWHYFNTAIAFWQFVFAHTEPKRKLWVLARSLVFDFTVVEGWKYLRELSFKLKFFHDSGATSIITVKSKMGSIVFLDIMNWFTESLKKTGERIGIPKLIIDFDTCSDDYLKTYCKRDVEIELENFKRFIKFLEGNSISRLCYTRASTAMAAYLFTHYKRRIWIHNNEQAISLERKSYHGGRTECFYIGELKDDKYYILDVNSLYPFVMRNNCYPVKYLKIYKSIPPDSLANLLKTNSAVAKVLIKTDEPVYAVRHKRTIFPIGRFWVSLTTPELLYALKHNHLKEVGEVVIYEQAKIFKTYVDRFYNLRQEFKSAGVDEYEYICKQLLNSLYGKFGQKAEVWKKIGVCPKEKDRVELCFKAGVGGVGQIRYLLGEVFELVGYEECFNSFPAIPAHVAAFARLHLWRLMQQAGKGNYFYCDTDSLIVNEPGLLNLESQINAVTLGSLKVVDSPTKIVIRGLKDYSTEKITVIKGIRKNALEIREGVYKQEQWPSFKGVLRSGDSNTYKVKEITKTLSRIYTKGYVNPDGWISPLVFSGGRPSQFRLF